MNKSTYQKQGYTDEKQRKKLTKKDKEKIDLMYSQGSTHEAMMSETGFSRRIIQRHLGTVPKSIDNKDRNKKKVVDTTTRDDILGRLWA